MDLIIEFFAGIAFFSRGTFSFGNTTLESLELYINTFFTCTMENGGPIPHSLTLTILNVIQGMKGSTPSNLPFGP